MRPKLAHNCVLLDYGYLLMCYYELFLHWDRTNTCEKLNMLLKAHLRIRFYIDVRRCNAQLRYSRALGPRLSTVSTIAATLLASRFRRYSQRFVFFFEL